MVEGRCTQIGKAIKIEYVWAALRICMGWILFWAFFDKLFGLGYATPVGHGWIDGYSPTKGFLEYGTSGVFSDFWKSVAGNAAIDVLLMAGLLLIGGALLVGIGVKIACIVGSVLMLLFYSAHVPPINNPIIEEHIIFIVVLIGIAKVGAGRWFGLGDRWSKTSLVRRFPILE
jgi:thiosulfate dehydrogenase [quinone] large subunit